MEGKKSTAFYKVAKIILLWDLMIFHSHDPLWRCTQISKEAKTRNKVMGEM